MLRESPCTEYRSRMLYPLPLGLLANASYKVTADVCGAIDRPVVGLVHSCLLVSTSYVNMQITVDEPDPNSRLTSLSFSIRASDQEIKPQTNLMIAGLD